ncbi:MAG: acyl carrier protein [Firmicutes bacterium]|nr:acyl carrier protein [Bacillota bacterium]
MENSKYYDQVITVIKNTLGSKAANVTPDSRIVEDLNADSLDVVDMLMTLEDETGIVISDDDAAKIKTVANIVTYLDAQG